MVLAGWQNTKLAKDFLQDETHELLLYSFTETAEM
jgi:hypothetical protein